jgi:hypothetical protein
MCSPDHLSEVDAFDKAIVMRVFVQEIVHIIKRLLSFPQYCRNRLMRGSSYFCNDQ